MRRRLVQLQSFSSGRAEINSGRRQRLRDARAKEPMDRRHCRRAAVGIVYALRRRDGVKRSTTATIFGFCRSYPTARRPISTTCSICEGVDAAVTQSDVFEYFSTQRHMPNLANRVQYVVRLPISELHILARNDVHSLEDLRGKKVNFGPAGTGASSDRNDRVPAARHQRRAGDDRPAQRAAKAAIRRSRCHRSRGHEADRLLLENSRQFRPAPRQHPVQQDVRGLLHAR
jgi:hypothetical protein